MTGFSLESNANIVATSVKVVNEQPKLALSQYELFRTNTGWKQSSEQYRENAERRVQLVAQTERIADALESQGIQARQEDSDLLAFGEVTGEFDRIEGFRSVCFLPTVAQRDRRPILNSLMYFHQHHQLGGFLRLAVVTAGERIPLYGDLRGTMQKLHRDISRWAHEADKVWNVAVIYRGSEFTYDTETQSFHPHANVLYAPRKALKGERWAEFLSWTRKRLGAHWQDSGRLEKPQEAIKYPFKPIELDALDAPALAWLFHQTFRLNIAQPMREFKNWREELIYQVTEQERVHPFTGEVTVKRVKEKRSRPLKVGMVNTPEGARLKLIEKAPGNKGQSPGQDLAEGDTAENLIICRLSPQFRFSPYAEPVTMVMNYTPDPVTVEGKERLQELQARKREARRYWDANGAPDPRTALAVGKAQRAAAEGEARKVRAFNVHTSRLTVQNSRPKNSSSLEPPGSRPGPWPECTGSKPGTASQNSEINQKTGNGKRRFAQTCQ